MAGSKPVMTYAFKHSPPNRQLVQRCIDHLLGEGWKWYVDFYVDWETSPLEVQIYKEELVLPVRDFLFEESFEGG